MSESVFIFKPACETEGGDARKSSRPKALIWFLILSFYFIAVCCVGWGWATLILLALSIAGATLAKGR